MNKLSFFVRSLPSKQSQVLDARRRLFLSVSHHNTKSDDDNNTNKSESKRNSEEALKKLNLLLKQMVEEDVINTSKLDLAKPRSKKETVVQSVKEESPEKKIVNAAKKVAESLGGNVKQTESELLTKLLSPSVEDKVNDQQTISASLSEIVKGMKIDRESKASEEISRANQVRNILQMTRDKTDRDIKKPVDRLSYKKSIRMQRRDSVIPYEKIDLFGSEPLGIFSVHNELQNEMNSTWKMLHKRELALAVTHPPSNYFQQMILWTQQGKIWKFPIDNEQGMEEEQNVYFTEHIFLEKHLEPWCPPKGPIRHFMELVCVGLSKNPYMSVEHKKEHIAWYREYFSTKKQLLQEIGAIPPGFGMSNQEKLEG